MGRILITGSNGLIGRSIAELIIRSDNNEVFGISSDINRSVINEKNFLQADITDFNTLSRTLKDIKPDVIIHTAAMGSPDMCERERDKAWKINVEVPGIIAEYCRINNSYLLHWSTDFVFDGLKGFYLEDDEANPVSYYGITKLESEKVVADILPSSCIFRTILVYGLYKVMTRQNVLTRVINAGETGRQMKIAADQYRMPTYVRDLANATMLAVNKRPSGVFHVSGNEYMSVYDFVLKIAEVFGVEKSLFTPVLSSDLNESAKRPFKTGFIINKAISELGYRTTEMHNALSEIRNY